MLEESLELPKTRGEMHPNAAPQGFSWPGCIIACCECPPILLFWGLLMMFWAVAAVISTAQGLSVCAICIINVILQAIYAIILFYMGWACVNIWMQHGKEIIPPNIDIVGPAGEQVGSAA